MNTMVENIIYKHADEMPDKLAIAAMNGDFTYAELASEVSRAACFLKRSGIQKGDRILLSAVPEKEYFAFYFGLHLLGGICVPIAINAKQDLVNHIIESTDAKFLVGNANTSYENIQILTYDMMYSESDYDGRVEMVAELDDVADIIYTTGTTGLAKGVALTHRNLVAGAHNIINAVDMQEDDAVLAPLPLNHSNALGTMGAYMYRGASLIVHDGFTNIKNMEDRMKKYCCTAFSGAPAALSILDKVTRGHMESILGNMRYVEIGTAPMDVEFRKKVMQILPNVKLLINYGATEARRAVYMDLNEFPDKVKSIGRPVKDMSVKIIDDNDVPIESSADNIGRLVICGATCMQGYWNEPELSKEVLVAGGLATSDLAYVDEDGFIFLVGRANDVINIGGKKVSPFEIEDALLTNEKVAECACIPVNDPSGILGNVPVMYVVLKPEVSLEKDEMKHYLLGRLETYKVPVDFVVIEELPRNYVGKLDRKKLKTMWEDGC
ncbi:MAG: acyl--CoA ligase [Lachnospiraceae bacterium]|nr:acyl--CoA ligase [Lachnospiraceae bacterium]